MNVYSKISPETGAHVAGIYQIKIVPIEWLTQQLFPDFKTGKILDEIILMPGKQWIEISFIQETYEYSEKPKNNKEGSFFEITLSGNSNSLSATDMQILQTYRYHHFVAIIRDRQKRYKVIGNKDAGMVFQYSNKESSNQGGTQLIGIDMTTDLIDPAPFYLS